MKKTLSLLLTVAMLLAMIPAVVVSTSAATPTVDPIKITTHSATDNYKNGDTTQKVNWDKFWDGKANDSDYRFGYQFKETVDVIGKFDKPTKVGRVNLSAQYYTARSRNVQVFLSTDAENWVDLGYLVCNETNNAKYRVYSVYVPVEHANTEFLYVRILKDLSRFKDVDTDSDGTKDATYFDFNYALVYPRTELDEPVSVKHLSHNADNNARFTDEERNQVLNGIKPTRAFQVYNQAAGSEMIRGQFETPTKIDAIEVAVDAANGNRLQTCLFEASVDGETWKTIADTGSIAYSNYSSSIFQLNSTDKNTAYNYFRIIKNNTWSFSYLTLAIHGTEQGADFIGTQVKKDTDSWALRLVSTVDLDTATAVGYEITAMAEGMTDKTWDKSTDIVYNSIKETTTDGENTLTALGLGGKYIFTATIHSISIADYDAIDFFVKPYVVDANGNKVYSVEQQFTFVDGVLQ